MMLAAARVFTRSWDVCSRHSASRLRSRIVARTDPAPRGRELLSGRRSTGPRDGRPVCSQANDQIWLWIPVAGGEAFSPSHALRLDLAPRAEGCLVHARVVLEGASRFLYPAVLVAAPIALLVALALSVAPVLPGHRLEASLVSLAVAVVDGFVVLLARSHAQEVCEWSRQWLAELAE
jgi:hypothetical protein